jgi:hypothetical protein
MLRPIVLLAAVCAALLSLPVADAETVYQAAPDGNRYVTQGKGDQLTLGGAARFLTDFSFYALYQFGASNTAYTPYVQFSLYTVGQGGLPGTLLYTTTATGGTMIGTTGTQTEMVTITLPAVEVPANFVYTLFDLVPIDGRASWILASTPSIGSTGNGLLTSVDGSSWSVGAPGNGDTGLGVTINASPVPEPATFAFLILGGLGLVSAARRRSR